MRLWLRCLESMRMQEMHDDLLKLNLFEIVMVCIDHDYFYKCRQNQNNSNIIYGNHKKEIIRKISKFKLRDYSEFVDDL